MRRWMSHRVGLRVSGQRGFTLIELMITMLIVMLLAAIAYPSYAGFIVKARRAEGQVALMEAMQQQERYYSENNTYLLFGADERAGDAERFRWWSGERAAASAYELSGHPCPGQALDRCIELRAEPGTVRVDASFRDRDCQTLILTSAGHTRASGPGARCWP